MANYNDTATVSGSVVSISDGADEVGAKSCVVTVSPTLSGVSSVTEKQTGRNLIPFAVDYPNFTQTKNDMTISVLANGKVKFNGTTTANTDFTFYSASVPSEPHLFVKNGTYTFSNIGSASVKMVVSGGGNNGFPYREITNGSYTGTVTDETKPFNYIIFRISSGVTLSDVVIEPMLEIGSTAHAYEPYQTPTQYTASLGRTIYGGQVDIVNGTGKDNTKKIKLKSLSWQYNDTEYSYGYFDSKYNQTDMSGNMNFQVTGYDNNQNARSALVNGEVGVYNKGNAIKRIVIRDDSCTTLDQFLTKIADYDFVYETTDTPTDFTFTGQEVPTRLGSNTMWSEQGNTELTYYKSGYGFTSVTIHKETPDGEPVEQTAKLHKIVYGGTADVIRGTCEPKNLLSMTNYDGGVYNPDIDRVLNLTVSETQFTKNGNVYSVTTSASWKTFTVLFPIISGTTYYEKWTLSVESGQQGSTRAYLDEDFKVLAKYNNNTSDPIVQSGVFNPPSGVKYLAITWTNRGTAVQTLNITEPQIEKGTSASDFAPHFEPFTFPPISMSTDEGENTLYASEGDSVITYRKETD